MNKHDMECVLPAQAILGEGTLWDPAAQCLWWLDIYSNRIHRYEPVSGNTRSFATPGRPGCLALRAQGGLMVAMGNGFHSFDPETMQFRHQVNAHQVADTRMNDGKTDRQGRFWAGSMFEAQGKTPAAIGALYRLDPDLSCHAVVAGIMCSNGLAWSVDGRTMYFTDSATPQVWAWDFDPATAVLENRRVFIDLPAMSGPGDGATVDAEGCYWLTLPLQSRIQRYDPDGLLMDVVDMPVGALPTCCEFGGKGLGLLYVTTATLGQTPAECRERPWAGGLFAIDVRIKGLPSVPFPG